MRHHIYTILTMLGLIGVVIGFAKLVAAWPELAYGALFTMCGVLFLVGSYVLILHYYKQWWRNNRQD